MIDRVDWKPQPSVLQAEAAAKRAQILALLQERGFDAVLISRHENIAWATAGMVDVRVPMLRETGVGSLLITKHGEAFYLTTNNEAPRLADEEFCHLDYKPLVEPWYANDVEGAVHKAAGNGRIASDAPASFATVVSLQPLRLELMGSEVQRYRWLGRHAANAASTLLQELRPGMDEMTIEGMLAERLFSLHIMPSVYLTAVDDRVRSYRHAVPRNGILDRFGMLNFCARRWGLSVSITRLVHFGAMPDELDEKFHAVASVNARLLAATRAGTSGDALFQVAADAYAAAGFTGEERMHHQGGATGYLEREWIARPGAAEQVSKSQAFAWNPSLQGAKVEDTVLLLDGSIERLTGTPDLPVVTTMVDGIPYQSAGVLER